MVKNVFHTMITIITALTVSFSYSSVTRAQASAGINIGQDLLGEGGASKGKTAATIADMNGNTYRDMKKIRSLINKGKNLEAARRSITFIQGEERGNRSGIAPSEYFREAYNNLCISSSALGKVDYAMDACNKSLALNSNHWESLKSRATLYFLTKDYNHALEDFQTALANAPEEKAIKDVLKQNISVVESKIK